MKILTGEKIVLRPLREEDAEKLFHATNDPELRRLTGTQATFTLEQARRYMGNFATADDRVGFAIADPQTSEALGEVVILRIDPDNRSAAIRISLFHTDHLNNGYGTEAMRIMVDYGFENLNLHRLELDVFDFNERAIRVYEKIGFKREGFLRDTLLWEGQYHSTVIMAILEDDWRAARG